MSAHATSHATASHAYPHGSWSIPPAGFTSSSSIGSQSSNRSSNSSSHSLISPTGGGGGGGFLAPPGGRRYGSRTGNPYQSAVAKRRTNAIASGTREPRAPAAQPESGEDAERTPRRRVIVACTRCRRRKIRCSGEDGNGGACTNCKNANEPQCQFLRVNAASMRVRPREGEGWGGIDFNYDIAACRQYQSRGSGTVMSTMVTPGPATATTYAVQSGGMNTTPVGMYQQSPSLMYSWGGQGPPTGGYSGDGTSSAGTIGYGSYQNSYHGMPSPETSFMGENDLMERPSTASTMADAGAFALHSMAHGLPTSSSSSSSNASPYGHPALLTTPRSLPGPSSVLGSSRLPPSSSSTSSLFSRHSSYPSPVTTPVIHGASPAWSGGYEPSPYTSMATPVPSSMAAQSLERLPNLYSATATPPPPPPPASAESARDANHQTGGMGGSSSHHHQYGYGYGEAASATMNSGVKQERGGHEDSGADGLNNTMSGRY